MNEFQRKVDELIQRQGGYWFFFQMFVVLVEEVGEFVDVMFVFEGIKGYGGKEKFEEEFGDVFYVFLCIVNYYGIDVFQVFDSIVFRY